MNHKNKVKLGIGLGIMVLGVFLIILLGSKNKTLGDVISFEQVTSIEIINGSTGNIDVVDSKEMREEIVTYLSKVEVIQVKNEPWEQWSHQVVLIAGEQRETITFVDSSHCDVGGKEYSIVGKEEQVIPTCLKEVVE